MGLRVFSSSSVLNWGIVPDPVDSGSYIESLTVGLGGSLLGEIRAEGHIGRLSIDSHIGSPTAPALAQALAASAIRPARWRRPLQIADSHCSTKGSHP